MMREHRLRLCIWAWVVHKSPLIKDYQQRWLLSWVATSSYQNVVSGGAGLKGVCSSLSLFAMNFTQNRRNFRLLITARQDFCESAISCAKSAYGTAIQCPGVNMATQYGTYRLHSSAMGPQSAHQGPHLGVTANTRMPNCMRSIS